MRLTTRRAGSTLFGPSAVKIKAINQVHKQADTDGYNWPLMWDAHYDWNGWLKPGLDLIAGLGANCVKMIGLGVPALAADGVTFRPYLADRLRQYLGYAASLGLLVYWQTNTRPGYGATSTLVNAAVANAEILAEFPHVVAVDLWNEARFEATPTELATFMKQAAPAVRAAAGVPVTWSSANTPDATLDAAFAATFDYVDFWDIHAYHYASDATPRPVPSSFDSLRASPYYKPYLIGESGAPRQNAGSFFGGAAEVNAHWQRLSVMTQQPDCLGAVGFCLTDYNNQQFGVFDEAYSSARLESSSSFRGWRGVA